MVEAGVSESGAVRGRSARAVLHGITKRLALVVAENPSLPLLVVAAGIFVWMGADEGGFRGTTFLPVTLLMFALLAVGLAALPRPRPSRAGWVAVGLMIAYGIWSYLSILWADQQDLAWDGANRTVLYAIVFALFALWPLRARPAAVLMGGYALAIAGLGLVELLRAAGSDTAIAFFYEGRLSEPTGYANANVALWFTAFWPALILAGRREVPVLLRGLLLGSAGLLASLAVLGQSRSWFLALPVMAVVVVAVVPGRGRTIAAAALVGGAIAVISRPLLDTYERFDAEASPGVFFADGSRAALLAAAALAALGLGWALLERIPALGERNARRIGVAIVVAFVLAGAGGAVAFTALRGNPVSEAAEVWDEFKRGGTEPSFTGARIGTLGGTYRYEFWRVAWESFKSHPITGVGADNFGRDYLLHGRSRQTPNYPHSVAMRTLSQTGLVGTLLLGGAIAAALLAAGSVLRRQRGLGSAAAGAGIVAFSYFIAHGMLDWLWEFAGLGAPAFALLAAATAIGARPPLGPSPAFPRLPVALAALCVSLLVTVGVGLPWLAERDLRKAREVAASNPAAAVQKLSRSAALNPLSPLADKTAAVIEIRRGRLGSAERRFRNTLERDPGDPFVWLQLSALASATDDQAEAGRLIRRARSLNPRDAVIQEVQRRLKAGRHVSPASVDRLILQDIDVRTGPG